MGGQNNGAESAAPNKLSVLEQLRQGHGLLSPRQFATELKDGNIDAWKVGPDCYVLIGWGVSEHGKTLNILTAVGDKVYAEQCMRNIEVMARKHGAKSIMSVGRPGWTAVATAAGYTVEKCILMKKVLHADTISQTAYSS